MKNKFVCILALILGCLYQSIHAQENKYLKISGTLESSLPNDTIVLHLHQEYGSSSNGYLPIDTSFIQVIKDEAFSFSFPIKEKVAYITIDLPSSVTRRLNGYNPFFQMLVEPGDDVHINYEIDGKIEFFGKGAEKLQWQFEKLKNQAGFKGNQIAFSSDPKGWLSVQNAQFTTALESLEKNRSKFSSFIYLMLKADLYGSALLYQYRTFNTLDFGYAYNENVGEIGREVYNDNLYESAEDTTGQNDLALSAYYASYLLQKTLADGRFSELINDKPVDPFLNIIGKYNEGILKDKILVSYLFSKKNIIDDEFKLARGKIVSAKYLRALDSIYSVYAPGAEVSDNGVFKDVNGKEVRLSDFRGKVILIDLWFSGCAGCVSVANALPKVEHAFEDNHDIVFLSISIDKNKQLWLKSIQDPDDTKEKVGSSSSYSHFTTKKAIYLYTGGVGDKHEFIKTYNPKRTYPCLLLIDKKGKIFSSSPPRPEIDNGSKLIESIQQVIDF